MAKKDNVSSVPAPKHPPTSTSRSELREAVRHVVVAREAISSRVSAGGKADGKKK
jgi:hypothetical protein